MGKIPQVGDSLHPGQRAPLVFYVGALTPTLPQDIAATPESEAVIEDNGSLAESGDSNEIATMTDVAEALLEALPVTHVAVEPGLRSDLTGASPDAEASVPASEEDEPIS
jgi:hypothetical protein